MAEDDSAPRDSDAVDGELALATALEAGVRTQRSGGYTELVYETMETIARSMGADRVEGSVTSVVVGLTVQVGDWSGTGLRRTPHLGVNFGELSALDRLARDAPGRDRARLGEDLAAIVPRAYPSTLVLPMLGVACGSFAAMFGADLPGIVLAAFGGFAGALVRYLLSRGGFKPFIYCLCAAFVASSIVAVGADLTTTLNHALAASVLFLVPGVPLLNGAADLLATHYLNGLVRLTMSLMIVLASGIGVLLAVSLWPVAR